MTSVEIKPLIRYRVDLTTEPQPTALGGKEHLIVLVLKAHGAPEIAYAISKVDAMKISVQMQLAAQDAQKQSS